MIDHRTLRLIAFCAGALVACSGTGNVPAAEAPAAKPVGANSALVSGFANITNGRLYYELSGTGPVVTFVHGFALDRRQWERQATALAPQYRVLRYDARGFGRSSVPKGPYSHDADLKELLDHLGIEKTTVVGLSMGAYVAGDFALAYPEHTAAVVMADTIYGFPVDESAIAQRKKEIEAFKKGGKDALLNEWWSTPNFKNLGRWPDTLRKVKAMQSAYSFWHQNNSDPETYPKEELHERVQKLACPALVVYGALEHPGVVKASKAIAQKITGAKLAEIPDATHLSNMENPEAFNRALLDFLGSAHQPNK